MDSVDGAMYVPASPIKDGWNKCGPQFFPMASTVAQTSLSFIASAPTTGSTPKMLVGACAIALVAYIIHRAAPMHLTRVLVAAITDAEKTYLEALEAGVSFNSDSHMSERLTSLQLKVSTIREATLRDSLSYRTSVGAFFKGNSLTVLYCIREVREFETHMEIMKERRLCALDPRTVAEAATHAVSLHRRHTHSPRAKL
ncbi:hypothetical protein B0H17DRAFT_1177910 [Mycena rosella]|uniref:Uncharacterized protein n=1 Tax=Mycena rosella TaxID=1033263 RepID=A0AAD7GMS9_MYCRO|nr:hypothetical protein B0H17DRAFT_1177910 [Mycena rosella]